MQKVLEIHRCELPVCISCFMRSYPLGYFTIRSNFLSIFSHKIAKSLSFRKLH